MSMAQATGLPLTESLASEDVEKVVQKMKSSLESTLHALTVFVDSLEKSGFRKAIPEYRQLQHVLIQQRLWSDRQSRKELQPIWESIAQKSDNLYQIMKPFAEIMNGLRNIDKIKAQPTNNQDKLKMVSKIDLLEAEIAELRHDIGVIKQVTKKEIVRYESKERSANIL